MTAPVTHNLFQANVLIIPVNILKHVIRFRLLHVLYSEIMTASKSYRERIVQDVICNYKMW